MPNLHPPLTAFPFATITILVVLELVCFALRSRRPKVVTACRSAIRVLLYVFLVSVVVTFFSGYQGLTFAEVSVSVPMAPLSAHQLWARAVLFCSVPLVILGLVMEVAKFNRSLFRAGYLLFLLLNFILVVQTGLSGGQLVFSHAAGVKVPTERLHQSLPK